MNTTIALLLSLVVGLVLFMFFMCLNKLVVETYLLERRLNQIVSEHCDPDSEKQSPKQEKQSPKQ
ncbi:MAG: hypothetical protein Q4F75_01860 [Pseudomonadota bacterium]|nr:hypothetical protein [Pseudomonadota bacterium]